MPYVPSLKTDGKSDDRKRIDAKVELVANYIAKKADSNFDILFLYKNIFEQVGDDLTRLHDHIPGTSSGIFAELADTIFDVGKKYNYEGAFLGELNYAITRLIQRVPQLKVKLKHWPEKSEIRYWLYAVTTEALFWAADHFKNSGVGISGVFIDIKDEYKRRVNTAYEAAQIVKSGDCYDTPYYTRLIEVLDDNGKLVGHQEIMVKRSEETLHEDVIGITHMSKLVKVGG